MSLNLLITIAAVILNLFLGFLVFTRNRKNFYNFSFFIMTVAVVSWLLSNYAVDIVNLDVATFLIRLTNFFGNWAVFMFFVFVWNFPKKMNKIPIVRYLLFLPIVFSPLLFTNLIISGVIKETWGYTPTLGIVGNLFLLGYLPMLVLASIVVLIYKTKKSDGIEKTQLKVVSFGFALTTILALVSSVLLPVVSQNAQTAIYAPLTTIFFIAFTSYAIVKHRLMDIRMVVARSVSYSLLVFILAGFYAGVIMLAQAYVFPESTYSTGQVILQIALALVMVFTFQPLRRWLNKVTDKIFFKETYNTEEFLDVMAHTVGSSIILIEMLYKTLDLIIREIKVTRGTIAVFDDSGEILETQSVGYKKSIKLDKTDLIDLAKDGVVVADELSENSKYKKLLRKYDATVSIPIKTESSTDGILLLGEKQSGDMFSENDIKVFEIIAPEIAVAITNAKAYEKIEKFNVTLRQEVKKATAELEKKNEQLRELDKAKDEFISMASHQLRTPLTAIKGYLSMLLEGDAGEIRVSQYDFVNEAFQGANRMVGLINDLLNVSRMETGRFFLEPVEVDMEKVVNEEVKQLTKQAKEKGLKLEVKVSGKIPKVWVDETKIRQVVMNFADNAIYYTTKGSVTVSLEADKTYVIYKVKDTGIGVPKEQQKNLFEKFFRADNARHVRPDGTGLGIYLARRVIDDHGGELVFESVEGKGSTFGFKIPIKSKLKVKRVTAPSPKTHSSGPEIGELAAGIGVDPKALEATRAAGVEHPLADSSDKKELEKETKKVGKKSK
ncbi:MAG: ATP-binding protein [Patescibacteria group bacterium]|nr:ATP-binding protein [Patescibacteria group bacterium]